MSLICNYTLKCDMCGATRDLGTSKFKKHEWEHSLPVIGNGDVHYEPMNLCPSCFISLALRKVTVNGETRYVREGDSPC